MACCGGSKRPLRVQATPQSTAGQTISPQAVKLKPPSTMRVFVNNQKTGERTSVQRAVRRPDPEKCPLCQHTVMMTRVGGRPRKQCTNFSCRHIIQ